LSIPSLNSKIVTAVFAGGFYVEESDRNVGIRVVPLRMPGGLAVGSIVDPVTVHCPRVKTGPDFSPVGEASGRR